MQVLTQVYIISSNKRLFMNRDHHHLLLSIKNSKKIINLTGISKQQFYGRFNLL